MKNYKSLIPTILIFLFEIVIGVLLIIDGQQFTKIIIMAFGGLLILGAVIALIRSLFVKKKEGNLPKVQLSSALIMIAVGIFFIAAAGIIMPAITLVLGIIMAISGLFKLSEFFYIRKLRQISWIAALSAVVTIIIGFVIAFNPFGATDIMWKIIGVLIIVSAALDIISIIYLSVVLKKASGSKVDVEGREVDGTKLIEG